MATRKAGSAAKKTTRSKSQPTKTTVTTVKTETASASSAPTSKLRMLNSDLSSSFIGEFIGAFALVSAFLLIRGGDPLVMGFVLVALVLMVGTLSGAHLNPLITVGAWVTRRLDHLRTVGYLAAQLLGAGAAFVLLSTYLNGAPVEAGAVTQPLREVFSLVPLAEETKWYIFAAEVLGASIFAFAFASVYRATTDRVTRALTIGFGFFVAAFIAGIVASYVGGQVAINPAIALAASAVDWTDIDWFAVVTYLGAPLVGGVIGFALRDVVETK